MPVPLKPSLQVHSKDPMVSVQLALTSQLSTLPAHSSISTHNHDTTMRQYQRISLVYLLLHTVPFPSKPASQVHKKLPIVSVQRALRSQSLRVSLAHSSISALPNNIHNDGYCISSMLAGRSCELTSAVDSTSTKARVARASEATNCVTAGSIGITIVRTSHTLINICHHQHRG